MSSVRSVTVVPAGLDPFARRRTVTSPVTGQAVSSAPLTGPTTITVPLGPPGPPGQNGASSAETSHMERDYAAASTVWEWDHALGYTPGVQLMLSDRSVIGGAITHNGPDFTRAEFHVPVAGIMALS